jgi:16S rRNA (guanine(527)-N(7))-methyltransferase RsmG
MPSAKGDERGSVPPDLAADYEAFGRAVQPWLDSRTAGGPAERQHFLEQLSRYGFLVHEHVARLSLIASGDRPVVFTRHVLDSLNLASCTDVSPGSLLDVGSGAGFPGIPLAIVWPRTQVTLLESRDRKAGFLEQAVRRLSLDNVRVVCDRLERVSQDRSMGPVGAVTVRAVGDLPRLIELAEPLAEPSAWWAYFLGGRIGDREAQALAPGEARIETGVFGGRMLRGAFHHHSP